MTSDPGPVSIPISTPRVSLKTFAKSLWRFSTSDEDPVSNANGVGNAPVAEQESGASWVIDREGLRLEGYRRLPLAFHWVEISGVTLELQQSQLQGLQALRIGLWPVDPAGFAAAHPKAAALWDETLGTYSLVLSKGSLVPQTKTDLALVGLRHAGPRFDGRLRTTQL